MNGPLPAYTLQRQASSNNGTLGEIFDPARAHVCYTCELPWLDNETDKSCIPTGTYPLQNRAEASWAHMGSPL